MNCSCAAGKRSTDFIKRVNNSTRKYTKVHGQQLVINKFDKAKLSRTNVEQIHDERKMNTDAR